MDWLDLLGVQRTLKSLLQLHNSKASILGGSAFLMIQLSHSYMTTGKTIALTAGTAAAAAKLLQSCLTLCDPMDSRMTGFSVIHYLLDLLTLMSIELMMPSNHLILYHPLLLLPSVVLSIRVFSSESALHIRWPKYWSFSSRISPSNEYSGLISFRIDWFDLLAVQGTLKSLLQHHSLKASILWCSALMMVQLSHLYMTTGKAIAFTIQTFVSKVISLLFNMWSRFVIAFLPRSKGPLV